MIKEFVGAKSGKFLGRLQRFIHAALVLVFLLAPSPVARAVLTIEIIGTGGAQFPIAIVPFRAVPIAPFIVIADAAMSTRPVPTAARSALKSRKS